MATCVRRWVGAVARLGVTGWWAAVGAAGCSHKAPDKVEAPVKSVALPSQELSPTEKRLHQPFPEAVLLEPPDGQLRPPDRTKAGKSVPSLYEAIAGQNNVAGLWSKTKFTTPEGKRLAYQATIKTDLGNIEIELWPDAAPNHVRNFVALARSGYYDGLEFDRTVREEIEGQKDTVLEYVEAGCPLGTADPSYGSIGYWLKPELSDQVKHEAGTIGAWHAEEVETAACKFYITLDKAPWMDGNWTVFGKVTHGLDVVRAIRTRPVRQEDKDRPQEPVVIRAVTIDSRELESGGTGGLPPEDRAARAAPAGKDIQPVPE